MLLGSPRRSNLVISRNHECTESDHEPLLYSRSLFVTWLVDALALCFAGERALSEGRQPADGEIDSFELIFAPAGFAGFQFGRRIMTENTMVKVSILNAQGYI